MQRLYEFGAGRFFWKKIFGKNGKLKKNYSFCSPKKETPRTKFLLGYLYRVFYPVERYL
jgi:hypothetical protein